MPPAPPRQHQHLHQHLHPRRPRQHRRRPAHTLAQPLPAVVATLGSQRRPAVATQVLRLHLARLEPRLQEQHTRRLVVAVALR